MLGFFEICKGCSKRRFYITKRSYNFYWLPIGKIKSEDKICAQCKKNVVQKIKSTTPPPKESWILRIKCKLLGFMD